MDGHGYYGHENWLTRLNYSPRARGLLATAVVGLVALPIYSLDHGAQAMTLPTFLRGRLWDGFGGFLHASFNKTITGWNTPVNMTYGLFNPSTIEIAQGLGLWEGTFDWGDFGAYAVGALAFGAYDAAAKALYDSGATIPVYKALGIQDRRVADW